MNGFHVQSKPEKTHCLQLGLTYCKAASSNLLVAAPVTAAILVWTDVQHTFTLPIGVHQHKYTHEMFVHQALLAAT